MVLLFERLFCHHLKKFHKLDNHRPQLLSPPLGAFRSHVSDCLNQLQLNNNSDESFVPSSSLSLPWILRCLELLPAVNKAFAKLVMDINDYPISKWAAASVDEHLSITLTLLNYLNSIASSLSHLSHARLAMSHALGLLDSSPALAIERLQGAIRYFNINPGKEHYLKVEENMVEAASTNHEERLSSSGEERAIQEALTAVKSIGFWVSAAVLAGLSGDSKPYLDMKDAIAAAGTSREVPEDAIAAAGTSREVPYSSLMALDSSFRAAVIDGRPVAIREVGRVNEAAACLVAALEEGKDGAAAAEELGKELEEMQRLLDAIGNEANGIFSEILAHRHELLDRLRLRTEQKEQS